MRFTALSGWGLAAALVGSLIAAPSGSAAMSAASATPERTTAPLGRSASVSVRWSASTGDGGGPFVRSDEGVFRLPGGQVLDTVSTTLSRPAGELDTVTFSESVLVPADVIQRAHEAGAMSVEYARTFEDADGAQGAVIAAVGIDITGSAGADFELSRLSLRFEDGSALRVVGGRDPVQVLAEVAYSGAGQLEARWEVATPPSTDGSPVFRTLRTVRRYLGAGGRDTLAGPELPTERSGLYLVRLTVTAPEARFEAPLVRYYVSATEGEEPAAPVTLRSPGERATLGADTTFAWGAVDAAGAYKLELYPVTAGEAAGERPVAGMLVSGDETAVTLTALARSHLEPGRAYRWRVRAIGDDGRLVGESPLRALRVPSDAVRPRVEEARPDGGE